MSKSLDTQDMVQRILAVAEILSTVATPEEIRTVNVDNVTPLFSEEAEYSEEVQS